MDLKKYWEEKHVKYSQQDWIDKPTIFSKFAIQYFPKYGNLLDLGCGHGQDSRYFSENGYKVTATEFSDKALEFAKLKGDLKISYLVHDLNNKFPFENSSFDIVYSHLSIQFFDNKVTEQIFSEMKRVIKAGGILALMVNSFSDPEVGNSKLLYDDLYEAPDGLIKRFYNKKSLERFVQGKFETVILDSRGKTYKDSSKKLVRYIGRKI